MNLLQEDTGAVVFLFAPHSGQRMEEMMKRALRKAAVLGLSTCLALTSLAGCSKKDEFNAEAAAITVNGDVVPAGLVKFMSHYTQAYAEDMYNSYFGSGSFNMAMDESGATLGDMVVDSNVEGLKQMILAEQKMEEYGVSLTDEEKENIEAAAAAFIEANDEEVLEKMCATQETVARYLELLTIQTKVETAMEADVDTEVSDEEAAQRTVQYAYFAAETEAETEESTEDTTEASSEAVTEAVAEAAAETEAETETETAAETETETAAETETETTAETAALTENETAKTQSADETETETEAVTEEAAETETETETETEDPAMAAAKEEAYAKAAEMIEMVKSGEDFEEAVKAVKEDEEATASELTFGEDNTSVAEGIVTATEGLADGTLVETPIEAESGYYVVQVISELDREATDARKLEIIEERKSELVSELYTEWEEASEITQDDEVIATIVFDFSLTSQTEAATEAATEAVTEASGTEAVTETESETGATEAVTENETAAAETEAVETETETAAETETEMTTETETVETETESETEA